MLATGYTSLIMLSRLHANMLGAGYTSLIMLAAGYTSLIMLQNSQPVTLP